MRRTGRFQHSERRIWAILVCLAALVGCGSIRTDNVVMAHYRGGEVTAQEYRSWLEVTDGQDDPAQRQRMLTTIAVQEALAEAARKRGAGRQPAVRLALLDLETRLLEKALRRNLSREITIDEEEIGDWLALHSQRLQRPRRVRLSNIFKQFDPHANRSEIQSQMEAIRLRLLEGEDWAEVALSESDSQTRFRHGRIGLIKPGDLESAMEEVAYALAPGEISEVIESRDGLTLLRCDGIEEEVRFSDEEKRQKAEQSLRRMKGRDLWHSLQTELLESVSLEVGKARLSTTPKDEVIARADGGWSLSLADAEVLLRFRGVRRPLADLPEERVGELLETLSTQLQAAERARTLGLDQDPELKARIHWRTVLTLGADELRRRVQERFEPLTEEEVRAYFEAHRERYRISETYHLEVISLRAERADLRQRYEFAQRLEADLRAGRIGFAEAARRHSQAPSAGRGGELGWLDREQVAALGPHLFKSVTRLAPGELGRLVQQPDSLPGDGHTLWLVRLLGRREARPLSFEEVREKAENALGDEKTQEVRRRIEGELIAQLEVRQVKDP